MNDDNGVIHIEEQDLSHEQSQQKIDFVIEESDLVNLPNTPPVEKGLWGDWEKTTTVAKESVDIFLLIDTSGSMEADDFKPNRMEAAKQAAKLFCTHKVMRNYNDRVGVIGFGGSANLVHPLDSDLDSVEKSLIGLKITHSGTLIGTALQAAATQLAKSTTRKKAIVLLSDGADTFDSSDPVKVASALQGIVIFTIGMGTKAGAMVNLPTGKQQVVLNEAILKQIAKVTRGDYILATDIPTLQGIYQKLADY